MEDGSSAVHSQKVYDDHGQVIPGRFTPEIDLLYNEMRAKSIGAALEQA